MSEDKQTIKLADFGFAANIVDNDGFLNEILGTSNYMAPELHLKRSYSGKSVDMFALGVTLFAMITCQHPFETAEATDVLYRCIAANRPDIFWRHFTKNREEGDAFFS